MKSTLKLEPVHQALSGFPGHVRLFPLPNLVMFPNTVVPLHIFEPRYRLMLEDALSTDRFIAISLLGEGWETDYYGRPPLRRVGCVGKVVQEEALPGGRYNIMLEGLMRARIDREHHHQPYRIADVTLLEDLPLAAGDDGDWRRRFGLLCSGTLGASQPTVSKAIESLLDSSLPMNVVADIITAGLPLEPDQKQQVLETTETSSRITMVMGHLAELLSRGIEPPAQVS